jgi:hypothetical protein
MKMDKKKLAAATAAVFTYIRTQEEAAFYSVPKDLGEGSIDTEGKLLQVMPQQNIWGITGRQVHMQANSMMQLRMFK